MSNKTYKDAAKKLPEEARIPFIQAWEATNCMDLYEGRLEEYLMVIRQRLERQQAQIAERDETFKGIQRLLTKQKASIT